MNYSNSTRKILEIKLELSKSSSNPNSLSSRVQLFINFLIDSSFIESSSNSLTIIQVEFQIFEKKLNRVRAWLFIDSITPPVCSHDFGSHK